MKPLFISYRKVVVWRWGMSGLIYHSLVLLDHGEPLVFLCLISPSFSGVTLGALCQLFAEFLSFCLLVWRVFFFLYLFSHWDDRLPGNVDASLLNKVNQTSPPSAERLCCDWLPLPSGAHYCTPIQNPCVSPKKKKTKYSIISIDMR